MPQLRSYARTDVGRKRKHNEDSFLNDDALGLFIVADGMGGHAAGEVASSQAVKSIRESLALGKPVLDAFARSPTVEWREQAAQLMEKAILKAGVDIYRAHQLTEDHTIIQEQFKRGLITREQVPTADNKNVITRAVGIQPQVAVDTLVTDVLPGDLFLLCSDGLHGYIEDDELPQLLAQERAKLPDLLVDLALQRGGKDNITAVCLSVEADADEETTDVEGKTEILRRIPLFQHMTYKELLAILGIARGRQFEKGQNIIQEGEQGDELFVLFRGGVDVMKSGVKIAQLKTGGHFGEMGLVDQAPRSATVVAAEDTSAISIDRESLLKLMRRDSLLAVKLLWSFVQVMSERLRNTNDALTDLKMELDQVRARATDPMLEMVQPKKSGPPPFGQ